MGKKPKSSLPPPSVETSSDAFHATPPPKHHNVPESDSGSDSDESQSSSQEELPQNPNPLSLKTPPTKSATSSDSETDSGSESDSDTPLSNSKPKPLASKPLDQTPKSNSSSVKDRHALKRPAKTISVPVNDPPKRAKKKGINGDVEDEEMKDVKKSGGGGESNSKKLFQRLWSEEDEIAILKGMVEFTLKVGQDPYKYADAFYDFMKKSLHAEASVIQLKEKIRRLKGKFENNAKRGKHGEDPKFSKQLDREIFQLSKKVWGNAASGEKAKSDEKVAKSPKKVVRGTSVAALKSESKSEARSVDSNNNVKMGIVELTDASETDMISYLIEAIRASKGAGLHGLSEDAVKRGVELIGESKRKELDGQWKELQAAELELSVKRVELIANHARLILEAYKSSN
ncbi:unnamed protein product [Lupinus luteus]|uniref:Glabrous enhancer-binding protein-like DBD domain-containing protein n=1 Tax=Lupinus luteus TaxID=3873 RepID=A0AAV1WVS5_LUPLU